MGYYITLMQYSQRLKRILASEPQPNGQINNGVVESNESAGNPEVAPDVTVVDIKRSAKFVSSGKLTELADTVGPSLYITTGLCDVRLGICLTALPRGRCEASELLLLALDWEAMHDSRQKPLENPVEGGQPVHPFPPEGGELHRRHNDATETDDEEEEDRDKQTRQELIWREGGDGLAKANIVKLEQKNTEEHKARGEARGPGAPAKDTPVPAVEIDATRHNGVGNLGENGCRRPSKPAVDLCIVLAPLEDLARMQEDGLQLLNQRRADGQGHEDGEESIPEIHAGEADLVKCEAVEETRHDVQKHLTWFTG